MPGRTSSIDAGKGFEGKVQRLVGAGFVSESFAVPQQKIAENHAYWIPSAGRVVKPVGEWGGAGDWLAGQQPRRVR